VSPLGPSFSVLILERGVLRGNGGTEPTLSCVLTTQTSDLEEMLIVPGGGRFGAEDGQAEDGEALALEFGEGWGCGHALG
jgi:hypothetical protein